MATDHNGFDGGLLHEMWFEGDLIGIESNRSWDVNGSILRHVIDGSSLPPPLRGEWLGITRGDIEGYTSFQDF